MACYLEVEPNLIIDVALYDQIAENLRLLGGVKVTAQHDAKNRVQANVFNLSFFKESLHMFASQLLSFECHVQLPKTVKHFDLGAVVVDRRVEASPHQEEDHHVREGFRIRVLHELTHDEPVLVRPADLDFLSQNHGLALKVSNLSDLRVLVQACRVEVDLTEALFQELRRGLGDPRLLIPAEAAVPALPLEQVDLRFI